MIPLGMGLLWFGTGSYTITVGGNELLTESGGAFGFSEATTFDVFSGDCIEIMITFDDYSYETSWELTDPTGDVVASVMIMIIITVASLSPYIMVRGVILVIKTLMRLIFISLYTLNTAVGFNGFRCKGLCPVSARVYFFFLSPKK